MGSELDKVHSEYRPESNTIVGVRQDDLLDALKKDQDPIPRAIEWTYRIITLALLAYIAMGV